MDGVLIATAALMGLGGAGHCALMCGPIVGACQSGVRSAGRGSAPTLWWLVGRTLGYSAVGAAMASASSWGAHFVLKGGAGPWSPWLTVWALAHAAAFSLGVFLMWQGRQPLWLATLGRRARPSGSRVTWVGRGPAGLPLVVSGVAWAALPCGLLQSAWVVAALAPGAWAGATSMAAFSIASAPGLLAAPVLLTVLQGVGRPSNPSGRTVDWPARLTRVSGLMLSAVSAWALGHGLWVHVRDVC